MPASKLYHLDYQWKKSLNDRQPISDRHLERLLQLFNTIDQLLYICVRVAFMLLELSLIAPSVSFTSGIILELLRFCCAHFSLLFFHYSLEYCFFPLSTLIDARCRRIVTSGGRWLLMSDCIPRKINCQKAERELFGEVVEKKLIEYNDEDGDAYCICYGK